MDWINKFHLGHTLNLLSQMPSEFVSCVVTSPPYWGLRDYGIEPVIWDGDRDCKHDFDNVQRYNPARGKRMAGVFIKTQNGKQKVL